MKRIVTFLMAVLLLVSLGVTVFAGNGDGSGGGKDKPLTLADSTLADGSTDVPTELSVTLTFTKNVVNFTVKDNNMACFRLMDSAGNAVPVSVLMGDDQVDPDCKRIIGIQTSGLMPGEAYTLVISGNLQSKSGVSLGNDISIHFTTAGAPAAETPAPTEPPKPVETPKPTETPKPAETPIPTETPKPTDTPKPTASPKPSETPKPTATPKPTETPTPAETPAETAQPSGGHPVGMVILGGAAVVILAAVLVVLAKKSKQ